MPTSQCIEETGCEERRQSYCLHANLSLCRGFHDGMC